MQLITNAELKAKAKAAYEAKTLCAQMPAGNRLACYRIRSSVDGRTYNCAIGAAMTPETLDAVSSTILNVDTIAALKEGIVDFEDWGFAGKFQNTHDEWLNAREAKDQYDEGDPTLTEYYSNRERSWRRRFLRMLNS